MWKKDETQPTPPTAVSAVSAPRPETPRPVPSGSARATIGPSIAIRGEVTGEEDLLIQGRIDGSVLLGLHSVTVGGEGRVKANVTGRVITVEGEVEGDLTAQEQIILRGSAQVMGDIKAPRVVLEDGATFRGLVDMSAARAGARAATSTAAPVAPPAAQPPHAPASAPATTAAPSRPATTAKETSDADRART